MQILLTRAQIRAQVRALMGQQTTELVAGSTFNQYNAFIDAAYLKVFQDSTWVSSEVRVTVDVGDEQYLIPYPDNAGPGSITQLAIADADDGVYQPIEMKRLPAWLDFDLLEAMGGDEFDSVQGTPQYAQQRSNGIYLYPPNDSTARKLRVVYHARKTFAADTETSLVDAQAIIYWATAMAYGAAADPQQQAFYQGLYQDRIGNLRAWQHTCEAVTYRSETEVFDQSDASRPVPNWDTRPRV